jgi:protein-tyrosine-phosphatase
MMEAFLRTNFTYMGVRGAIVKSAGVLPKAQGAPANEHSIREMAERGYDISRHRGTFIQNVKDLERCDLVICADQQVADHVRGTFPDIANRVEVANEVGSGIPDPYEQGSEAYKLCAVTIERTMGDIAMKLKREWR